MNLGPALALPGRTLRLFGERWMPLAFWFLVGAGLHELFVELAAWVSTRTMVAGHALLALGILCLLASYVLMFLAVRPGLTTLARADGDGGRSARELLSSVSFALLPFLLVYSAWGLFKDDLYALRYRTAILDAGDGRVLDPADNMWQFVVAGAIAWVLVRICETITRRRRNPVTGVLAAVFEANWMFFGLFGLVALTTVAGSWIRSRAIWHGFTEVRAFVRDVLPVLPVRVADLLDVLALDLGWLAEYVPELKNGVALPIAWLAIAGACYGRQMESLRAVVGEHRLAGFDERWRQASTPVRRWARRFPPAGVREKYYPPLHAIRLMLAVGAPAVLLFCAYYSALELGQNLLTQALSLVVGPHQTGAFWGNGYDTLVFRIADVVVEPLKICLLAVTFDLAMSRLTARTADTAGTPGSPTASVAGPPRVS